MGKETTFTNRLAEETSPYLLQHAHNPVDWFPWSDEAFEKAKKEDKLVLVSIGYSACHWCHVMERESFENQETARLMNEKFICIKVDREERPDVDQVYMTAVQLMTGTGGWPLNCFTLPDGRPVYGGTYFSPEDWKAVINDLSEVYKTQPEKVLEYAEKLTQGVHSSDFVQVNTKAPEFTIDTLKSAVRKWSKKFDRIEGGTTHAPKFPMPNNYLFLLQYGYLSKDEQVNNYVKTSLEKMAMGGIYDQVGGGFSRYSTDMLWKVPHFEKMLYDNAQLVSLYSEAYQAEKNPLYKQIVYETIEFVTRELTAANGAFYSALDADTEGEEGKYYVWKKNELENLLGTNFKTAVEYYNINNYGKWEDGFILLRRHSDEYVSKKLNIGLDELQKQVKDIKSVLFQAREKRTKPGLDDKSLTSWNALMLKGFTDAYKVFGEQEFLFAALKNANFISGTQKTTDGGLYHNYKENKSTINGYLEDYAFTIEAFISLYEVSFDIQWLEKAKELMEYTIDNFYNTENGMFYFTSKKDKPLISRKMEITDNVTPASNSSIAKSLFMLGKYYENEKYASMSSKMLNNIKDELVEFGASHSNWAILMLYYTMPFFEIVIMGVDAEFKRQELSNYYIPNKILAGGTQESHLPLFTDRHIHDKTTIYVCVNQFCNLPVNDINDAVKQIDELLGG
ncbi:MAG: thioredoxin domain-containing protein [Bacteroidetes bacterium]|nr:thioredoxin domain-containing protein [Bacteroidota bacterium]HET6243183.1 thioredoxin domain-containing protein [Bacteroidia bacterium]